VQYRLSFSYLLWQLPVSFVGCSGLVSGNNGSPPPPAALDITNIQTVSVTTSSTQIVWTTNVPPTPPSTTSHHCLRKYYSSGFGDGHEPPNDAFRFGCWHDLLLPSQFDDSKGNHGTWQQVQYIWF